MSRILTALLTIGLLVANSSTYAQSATQRIRGDVVALDGANVRIKSPEGEDLSVKLMDDVRLTAVSRASAADIKAGSFVGATAVAQPDGTLKASEVHIFPESMRGTGEGHRPMDSRPGSTMTNATVSRISETKPPAGSKTTNATVAKVAVARSAQIDAPVQRRRTNRSRRSRHADRVSRTGRPRVIGARRSRCPECHTTRGRQSGRQPRYGRQGRNRSTHVILAAWKVARSTATRRQDNAA